jgi:DNA-directed RNA polymerase
MNDTIECLPTNESAMQREHQLEKQAAEKGARKVRKAVEKAQQKGLGADTPGGVALMKRAIDPVAKVIDAALEAARSGKAGRRHMALATMEKLPSEVLAYMTLRECVSATVRGRNTKPMRATTIAVHIGSLVEEELRLQAFDDAEPGLYATMMRRLKERGAQANHARRVFVHTANKNNIELPKLTETEKLHLGIRLIEMVIEGTGFFETINIKAARNKTHQILRATEAVAKWAEDKNLRAELLVPRYAPMVVPPQDWEGAQGGGYITASFKALPLVKNASRKHRELLTQADLGLVLRSLNAIQRTPWRINTKVLDVMTEVWERGLEIAMPNREDRDVPAYPPGHREAATPKEAWADVHPDVKKRWMQAARSTHEHNASTRGKRMGVSAILAVARELAGEDQIFFPHQLDFRGRAYAVPIGLNPQGNDHAKALLTFADSRGKPILDAEGAGFLAIDGANRFGFDKADLVERIAWVEERQDMIRYTAENPLGDLWWADADEPWRFLAWCFEYAAFLDHGYGYVTTLPCSADGSCNGLQHFSAMLRDPVGGAAVNLVPHDKPADIYQRVADVVVQKLRSQQNDWVSRGWLDFGINRKITKRPVMVVPYNGTFKSCMDYVRSAVEEKIAGGAENPFGDELGKHSAVLARSVWESIGDVVVAARQAMEWLKLSAAATAKQAEPISWITPSGFPAYQCYMDVSERRVKTRLQGALVYLTINEETDKINGGKQARSLSPNFVHSLDAAAMMLTIAMCLDNGVTSFAMIHDSYGTVAPDMPMLQACIRHAFVDMYEDHDVLAEFLAGLPEKVQPDCPQLPPKGTLNIREVLNSDFFFA